MTTDDGALTSTRKSFRAALADARGYVVDDISRRPAFISSLRPAGRAVRPCAVLWGRSGGSLGIDWGALGATGGRLWRSGG